MLGRGYREFTQFFPQPGWVEHDPEEILRVSLEAIAEALAAAGERPAALGITNQRETVVALGPAHPARRSRPRSSGRTGAPPPAAASSGRRARSRCCGARTGLVADPYFSATKLEWLLRDPELRRRAERGELAAGTVESWLVARLTGGRVHVSDHTNASRTLLYDLADRDWHPELLGIFGVPRELLPRGGALVRRGAASATPSHLGFAMPIAGLAGDQQSALFGQGCCRTGWPRTPTGPAHSSWCYRGDRVPDAAGRRARHRRVRTARASPPTRSRAACSSRARPSSGCATASGSSRSAAETDALARSVPDTGGVSFVPAFVGLGTPALGAGGARHHHRDHPRHHPRPPGARRAGGDRLQQRRAAGRDGGRTAGSSVPALRVDGGAAANDWMMQFQADILGVPVERPDMVETTALGAAGLAGIALGVWSTGADFLARRRSPGSSRGWGRRSGRTGRRGGPGRWRRRWPGRAGVTPGL